MITQRTRTVKGEDRGRNLQYSMASNKVPASLESLRHRRMTLDSSLARLPLDRVCPGASHFSGFLSYPGHSAFLDAHFRHPGRPKSQTRRFLRHAQQGFGSLIREFPASTFASWSPSWWMSGVLLYYQLRVRVPQGHESAMGLSD